MTNERKNERKKERKTLILAHGFINTIIAEKRTNERKKERLN